MLLVLLGLLLAPGAIASYASRCETIDDSFGWDLTIGESSFSGIALKDVRFNNEYLVEWANIPWLNLDTDSDLIRLEATSYVSCVVLGHGTWGEATIKYDTNAGSGYDGYADQLIELNVQYYNTGIAFFFLKTNAGSGYQEHPIYWNVAPCHSCSTADGTDDRFVIDASDGPGQNNGAEQHGETQWDEMVHKTTPYWVYDQGNFEMRFHAQRYATSGEEVFSNAWALKCTDCDDSESSQYTNGPWDYLNNDVAWETDVQLVVIIYQDIETGGSFTSFQSIDTNL